LTPAPSEVAMAIYEFECKRHGRFEHFGHMARCSEPSPCPDCGALSSRVVSAFSFASLTPTLFFQERSQADGGGYAQVGKVDHAPAVKPARQHNLAEV
jgi:putative FmdB family regulatory protein